MNHKLEEWNAWITLTHADGWLLVILMVLTPLFLLVLVPPAPHFWSNLLLWPIEALDRLFLGMIPEEERRKGD